jgi:hypothetical protein
MRASAVSSSAFATPRVGLVVLALLAVLLAACVPASVEPPTLPPTAPKDPTLAPAPPTIEPIPFPTGIFPGGEGAFPSFAFTIQNRWQAILNGEPIQVFAGALFEDSQQGLVIVFGVSSGGRYNTPTRAGAVRITEESGLRLTLLADDGTTFYFDVPSRLFVAGLETTVEPEYAATQYAIMTAIPEATEARPTGIFDAGAEFFHEGYRMQNAWQGLVDGHWANVVAGAHSSDPAQGLIFSSWEFPNAAIGAFFNTPARAGSVRIVAEQDARLTLEAADGTVFYWDIPSQSFVDSREAVAPTITPPPTHTPTATLRPPPTGYPAPATPPPATSYPGPGS